MRTIDKCNLRTTCSVISNGNNLLLLGNCNPRFLRSTMYSIPVSNEMMKQCKIPFGIACSPYAKTAANEVGI